MGLPYVSSRPIFVGPGGTLAADALPAKQRVLADGSEPIPGWTVTSGW
jgi:hypothetical protein